MGGILLAGIADDDFSSLFLDQKSDVLFLGITYFLSLFLTICIEVIALIVFCESKFYLRESLEPPSVLRVWIGMTIANALSICIAFAFFVL